MLKNENADKEQLPFTILCQVESYAAVINQIKTMQPWLPDL